MKVFLKMATTHVFDFFTKGSEDIQLWEIPAKQVKKNNHEYPTIPFQLQVFLDSITRHVWSRHGASLKGKQPGGVQEKQEKGNDGRA